MPDCRAFCCQVCDGYATWRLERRGDVAISWACNEHLPRIALDLQRAHEWTHLNLKLNKTHPEPAQPEDRYA